MTRMFAAAIALAASIGLSAPFAMAEPLKVVGSFSIIGDFAKNVGGEHIELTTLVGPNGDAHVYEPKPADAKAMHAADVVLVNGLHFEGFLGRLVEASATHAEIAELTKGVSPLTLGEETHSHDAGENASHADDGDLDPHAFQSIANAKIYIGNIADAFCAADAAHCHAYKANAEAYLGKLAVLEAEVKAAIGSIPAAKRTIITSHDAFGYFAHEYGVAFLAPEGISTEAEASAADVAALIRQVRDDHASAVFVENITNRRLIEQIASETGLKIGGELFSDALSPQDGPAATYIDMMRSNVRTIKGAILGS